MKFIRYATPQAFGAETLDLLMQHEAQNNLPIGFICNPAADPSNWLLASVQDERGGVVLTAACTPPFPIVLYETGNQPSAGAVNLLAGELKSMGFPLPGVLAERSLARRFAEAFAECDRVHRHLTMNIMRLDMLDEIPKAPGHCRSLREEDLFFVPYWEQAFGRECHVEWYDLKAHVAQVKERLGSQAHYIWEDGFPVSQAVHDRSTPNGAVINGVYTPPHFRSKGYATAVVAERSQSLLEAGHTFCCLFADAANPVSCGIYRKIGYRDVCVFEELRFG